MDQFSIVQTHKVLDEAFRGCLRLCEGLPVALAAASDRQLPTADIDRQVARRLLETAVQGISAVIVNAMHRVWPLLANDFGSEELNLYVWPGYHSLILHERIDYVVGDMAAGLGISGIPNASVPHDRYSECSHAEWHRRLFRPLRLAGDDGSVAPPSVDAWLKAQKPRASDDAYDILHSITIADTPVSVHDRENKVIELDGADPASWGSQLADGLNALVPAEQRATWTFPDRRDLVLYEEPEWRAARCFLYSLWFNVCFRDSAPAWLPEMYATLHQAGFDTLATEIERAVADARAKGWGERTTQRPRFKSLSLICLHRLLAHTVLTREQRVTEVDSAQNSFSDDRTLGVVGIMTSAPSLGVGFIEIVRPWLRSIFAMIRNSELTVFADKLVQKHAARARMEAGGFIVHELNVAMSKQFSNVRQHLADADEASVRTRRFAWDLIASLLQLAWSHNKRVVLDDEETRSRIRREFVRPLQALYEAGVLEDAIKRVATEVYEVARIDDGVRIPALDDRYTAPELTPQQFARCFLLVSEPIRNCCLYSTHRTGADWSVAINMDTGSLEIVLVQAEDNHLPYSRTFELLGAFLEEVDIGTAPPPRRVASGAGVEWLVTVNLTSVAGDER